MGPDIRSAPDNALDPTRLVERQELQYRAFTDLARGLDSLAHMPGPGLDLIRPAVIQAAAAAARLGDLARIDVPDGAVDGVRPHVRRPTLDEYLHAAEHVADRVEATMLGAEYVADLLNVPVDLVGQPDPAGHPYTRECRVHDARIPCPADCAHRRPAAEVDPDPADIVSTPAGYEPTTISPCRIHTASPCEGGCYGRRRG